MHNKTETEEMKNATESALADCCQTFGAHSDAAAQEDAIKQAVEEAIQDPNSFDVFSNSFASALEVKLRLIPNIAVTLDPALLLKVVGDLWDTYIEPRDFPFKALARSAFMWAAQLVINRILAV